jgi:rhomboid protease GluP
MAFGFPPKHSEELIISGISKEELYALAYKTAEKLNWHIVHTAKNGFILVTSNNALESQHELSFVFEEDKINMHCHSISNFFYDFGRNKNIIKEYIVWLNKQLLSFNSEELLSKYNSLEQKFQEESADFQKKDPLEKYSRFNGFWQIFIPQKDYLFTPIIVYINLFVFLLMWATSGAFLDNTLSVLIFYGGNVKYLTISGEYWRILSSAFIHNGFFHFIINMYAFINIGMILEPEIGSRKFALSYLLVALCAGATSTWINNFVVSVGASGAIFGMYGVFIALFSSNSIQNKAKKAILSSIGIFVAYTLLNGIRHDDIDNACHFGGFFSGIVVGYFLILFEKYKSNLNLRPFIFPICILLVSAFVFVVLYFANDKSIRYKLAIEDIVRNESKALVVYEMSVYTPKDTIMKFLKNEGLMYWEENLKKLYYLQTLNLPERLEHRNNLLIEYTLLRIETYNLIYEYLKRDLPVGYFNSRKHLQKTQDVFNELAE